MKELKGLYREFLLKHPEVKTESEISEHLRMAELKLEAKGYTVIRHVKNDNVFRLEVYGHSVHHLENVSLTVGDGYKLLLNAKEQEILIQ